FRRAATARPADKELPLTLDDRAVAERGYQPPEIADRDPRDARQLGIGDEPAPAGTPPQGRSEPLQAIAAQRPPANDTSSDRAVKGGRQFGIGGNRPAMPACARQQRHGEAMSDRP